MTSCMCRLNIAKACADKGANFHAHRRPTPPTVRVRGLRDHRATSAAARMRLLASSKNSKNDPNDALATGSPAPSWSLRTVGPDGHTAILRLIPDRHHDLTGLRTQVRAGSM